MLTGVKFKLTYLTNHPNLKYTLNNKEYELKDIFRRVAFSTNSLNNPKIFSDYYTLDGETFETISNTVYGTPDLFWLLVLANNVISNLELPKTQQGIQNIIDTKYSGVGIYFAEYLNGLKAGDIMVKVNLTGAIGAEDSVIESVETETYAIVKSYDPFMRCVWVSGDLSSVPTTSDIVGFYSLDNENNWNSFNFNVILSGSTKNIISRSFAIPIKRVEFKNTVIQFNDKNLNYSSPYYNGDIEIPSNVIGTYNTTDKEDNKTISGTDIRQYMSNRPLEAESITTLERKIIDDNQKFRTVKVLKPAYVQTVNEFIDTLLIDNNTKKIVIDIENYTYGSR